MAPNKSVIKQKHVSFGTAYRVRCFHIIGAGISAAEFMNILKGKHTVKSYEMEVCMKLDLKVLPPAK
jgi:hypothetical protein